MTHEGKRLHGGQHRKCAITLHGRAVKLAMVINISTPVTQMTKSRWLVAAHWQYINNSTCYEER